VSREKKKKQPTKKGCGEEHITRSRKKNVKGRTTVGLWYKVKQRQAKKKKKREKKKIRGKETGG